MTVEELYNKLTDEYADAKELHSKYSIEYRDAVCDAICCNVYPGDDDWDSFEVEHFATLMNEQHARLTRLWHVIKEIERFRAT